MQDAWMERLSEYLDEDLERSERESLEAHLEGCADCASVLAELKSVRERARAGLGDSPVPTDLWPRIEARIESARTRPAPVTELEVTRTPRGSRGARFSFSLPELIAASVAIAILSGGAVFALVKYRETGAPAPGRIVAKSPESGAPSPTEPAGSAFTPAPEAVPASASPRTGAGTLAAEGNSGSPHEAAISELRKALARQRDRLDPATIRTLESNLAIIDLAIDQAKRALTADPANTYVKEHLAETMRRKVELLQRATMLASTSNSEAR